MTQATAPSTTSTEIFVVGVGASAGGLEALEAFFDAVRPSGRAAFVVVQHLSPDFRSVMDELLSRHTSLAIHRAEDGMTVEPDALYLLPPAKEMTIAGGRLALRDRQPDGSLSLPIDVFFHSLALDLGPRAVAVVLSGSGSDGSRGIRAVHEAGGLVVAQSEGTARFDGMPRSAVDTGVVDLVLAPGDIPPAIARYVEAGGVLEGARADGGDAVHALLEALRRECGIDFSAYKPTTVARRIERRLLLSDSRDLADYAARVADDPAELRALYRDLLIGVTRFFRDPEAFDRLRREVLPTLVERLPEGKELRVWVAGCATGEEAYGLGILALEAFREHGRLPRLKIFATDAHRHALEVASAGVYPAESVANVPPELRERWFHPVAGGLQVHPDLRSAVVFAPHNVLRDAPFTRIDLVSCRNLLIYLNPAPQRKSIAVFHFALKPEGVLFLGPSETPGPLSDEFVPLDARWKLFRKRREVRLHPELATAVVREGSLRQPRARPDEDGPVRAAREALVREHVPPTLVVDESLNLVHAFNGAGRYLTQGDGRPSLHVPDLLTGEVRFVVAGALKRVLKERRPVHYAAVTTSAAGRLERVRVTVRPAPTQGGGDVLLVSFEEEAPAGPVLQGPELPLSGGDRVAALEAELRSTQENLQATVEEMETSNEELQATNEELIASNEELQSTNEELHSVNEELYSVNAEYQAKIAELSELSADMSHLLESMQVHTLFVDRDLRLRKFTPRMGELFNLLPQDLGRRIDGFAHAFEEPGLLEELQRVVATGERIEHEARDRAGNPYLLRILPYRPRQDVEGVVLTVVDVAPLKAAQREVEASAERYRALVRAVASVVFTLDGSGRMGAPQPEWEGYTGQPFAQHAGDGFLSAIHEEDRPGVRAAWARAVEERTPLELACRLWSAAHREHRRVELRAVPLAGGDAAPREWVASVADVQDAHAAQAALFERTAELQGFLDHVPLPLWVKDLAGRYTLSSRSLAAVTGLAPAQLVGRTDQDVLAPEAAAAARTAERTVGERGEALQTEEELPWNGARRTFLVTRFPLRNDLGRVAAIAGAALDNTAQREARARDREDIERRDRLLAMLSHELRTPLGAVLNSAELLTRVETPSERRDAALAVVKRQTTHMARLVEDLLDVARVTRDQITLRLDEVDLRAVAREAVQAAMGAAEKKGLALSLDLAQEPVLVRGDASRLSQIVTNLLSNALRHTERGGVDLRAAREGGRALVRVRDTGVGMTGEVLERAFDLFYQAPQPPHRPRGGLGIGLTLARRLAELHGGALRALSDGPGRGAEVVLELPAAEPSRRPEPDRRASATGLRIALVEDNDDIRETLRQLLELRGHEVLVAATGEVGASLIVEQRPDVALVDLGLPGIDGLEVARRVRSAVGDEVRLLAITGYGRADDRAAASASGFDSHLVKPVSPDLLDAALSATRRRADA